MNVEMEIRNFPNGNGLIVRPATETFARAGRDILLEVERTWPVDTGTSLRNFDVVEGRGGARGRWGWFDIRNKIRYAFFVEQRGGFIQRATENWLRSGRPQKMMKEKAQDWRKNSRTRRRTRILAEGGNYFSPYARGARPLGRF